MGFRQNRSDRTGSYESERNGGGVRGSSGFRDVFGQNGTVANGLRTARDSRHWFLEPKVAVVEGPSGPEGTAKGLATRSTRTGKPFGAYPFRKASGCAARHDARTASEHLTSFPVPKPHFQRHQPACSTNSTPNPPARRRQNIGPKIRRLTDLPRPSMFWKILPPEAPAFAKFCRAQQFAAPLRSKCATGAGCPWRPSPALSVSRCITASMHL